MALSINSAAGTVLTEGINGNSGTSSGTVTCASGDVAYVAVGGSQFAGTGQSWSWGGQAMTLVKELNDSNNYAAIFKLVGAPTSASSISYSGGASTLGAFIAFSATGNDTTTPTGTGVSVTANPITVNSNAGEIVVAAGFSFTGGTPTVNAPATMIGTAGISGFNGVCAQSAGANPNVTITFSGGGPLVGVSLLPTSSGTPSLAPQRLLQGVGK